MASFLSFSVEDTTSLPIPTDHTISSPLALTLSAISPQRMSESNKKNANQSLLTCAASQLHDSRIERAQISLPTQQRKRVCEVAAAAATEHRLIGYPTIIMLLLAQYFSPAPPPSSECENHSIKGGREESEEVKY